MRTNHPLLEEARDYVFRLLREELSPDMVYHNFNHTHQTVEAAREIGLGSGLSEEDLEIVTLAAWFHDTGYVKAYEDNERAGTEVAEDFLKQWDYPSGNIEQVKSCIMATRMPQQPGNLIEEVLCDADLSNLGTKEFLNKSQLLRMEWETFLNEKYTEHEWLKIQLDFLSRQRYHTQFAQLMLNEQKSRNLARVKRRLEKSSREVEEKEYKKSLKKKDFKIRQKRDKTPERGIETMFRTASRSHINLSSIADNKANIMLSINALIISVTISGLASKLDTNPALIAPTAILLLVCVVSLIFATLSTRPKILTGQFSKEDIEKKRANLLFFGNFVNMKVEEYEWAMKEMMADKEFLYGNLTRDLYYLGVVLNKKYAYLRIAYNVFMYGLVIAVLAFALAFVGQI